ncbi:hypothetical protein X805_21700 [Sphaerotilus natans subsp. natans DSM 6575]|uniref:Calpain catalytic domain-containing protein n=1 Tax=Sphaerotilus natans subsp. natans DSM 6575 TaxID=1286631 RepID=A0A059KL99_9BURK|nr:C2 family cysteine protease [Sphaerotilus natans]KDB52262.1 hypothetical protein X805_21700 [Sphaerotilus natans subsp. natans DSM 6575]SIQ76029.1 Calpain family cysteine protease [Sphaerotilus natans]
MALIANIASWSSTDYKSVTAEQIASLTPDQVKLMTHPDWLLPAAVAGFTAAQMPSISISWYWMTAGWLNALSPSAFAAIPAAGIAQIASSAVAGLDVNHAAALTPTQIASLASPQSLNAAAVAALSDAQLAAIPTTKWGSMEAAWLNAVQVQAFSTLAATSVAKFGSTAIAGLDVAHTQALTAAQLDALSVGKLSLASMAALTPAQLTGMGAAKWSSFTAAQLNAITPDRFALIPPASVAKFASAACAGLDVAHVQALGTAQMAALYYPEKLSLAAVAALSPAQVAAIGTSFYWMTPAWLNALSPAALAAIPVKGIGQLAGSTIAGLDVAHTQALTTTQLDALGVGSLSLASMAALTATQLTGMGAAKWSSFTAAQLNAIAPDKFALVPSASLVGLGRTVTSGLDAAHVQAMTVAQVAALYYPEWLNVSAVAALSPEKVAAIRTSFYWMDAAWLNALSPAAFAAITATGIGQLSGTAIAGLDASHAQTLTTTQLNAISLGSLSTTAVAALLPAQVASITQNFYWRTPAWLNALSAAAFAAIPPAGIMQMKSATIAALDATHVGAMTGVQVAALDYWQRTSLTTAQMGWFSASAIASFTTAQLDDLTAAQLAGLTATQAAGFTATQLASLTPAQLVGLSVSAVSGFNAAQLAVLGTNLCVLSPAAIAALPVGTFSQLSLMQLSSLQGDQVAALTAQQLGSLSATQANYLTPGQLDVLGSRVQFLSPSAVAGLSNANLLYVHSSLTAPQLAALTPAQTAAVQAAGSAVTALLATLTDAGVRAQVTAALGAGESLFSYNGLVQVLGGVAASIGAGGLTAAQMNDLKTLASAVSQTLGASSYLAKITANVVNGDLSNSWWTGGAASQTALGNLAVGSSADQMGKLVGKWFLGTDLPTWTGSATYTTLDAPLFSAAGPLASEINQGSIGDCYLMAAMIVTADDYASILETMFTDNGNGTWGVRFYAPNDEPMYVTVNNALPAWSTATADSGSLWVSLLEKAYVEWEVHYKGEQNTYDGISGGDSRGFQAIMGRSSTYYNVTSHSVSAWTTSVKNTVVAALASGQEVMYGSSVNTTDALTGKTELVGSHMFAVLGFDAATDEFILQNPWSSQGGSTWIGTFGMSAAELWVGSNNFIVTHEAAPMGALDSKYQYNVSQLVQAMAVGGGQAAALAPTRSDTTSSVTLLATPV